MANVTPQATATAHGTDSPHPTTGSQGSESEQVAVAAATGAATPASEAMAGGPYYVLTKQLGPKTFSSTDKIRETVVRACAHPTRKRLDLPPLQVVTVDHYNTKWAVVAIEWLRPRRIVAESVLRHPRRIYIEVLEAGMLPKGRYAFYNGVGGALADMIAHLIQPLRALSGHNSVKELLDAMRVVSVYRARYETEGAVAPFGTRRVDARKLATNLAMETETYGVMHLQFIGGPWSGTDVYIRTGKGFLHQSKKIVVEGYDSRGPDRLECDIQNQQIRVGTSSIRSEHEGAPANANGAQPAQLWFETQKGISIPDLGGSGSLNANEYVEVFKALTAWATPDSRFFPSVDEATAACNFFYEALLRDRAATPDGLTKEQGAVYPPDFEGTAVLQWLKDEAGW